MEMVEKIPKYEEMTLEQFSYYFPSTYIDPATNPAAFMAITGDKAPKE